MKERGIQQSYLIDQLGISRSTFIRKRNEKTFTYLETKKIIEILSRIKPVSFDDLDNAPSE